MQVIKIAYAKKKILAIKQFTGFHQLKQQDRVSDHNRYQQQVKQFLLVNQVRENYGTKANLRPWPEFAHAILARLAELDNDENVPKLKRHKLRPVFYLLPGLATI